jgi:beta-phosphoglucomutase-like phosphatase (HAD superfamily)
LTISAVIFDCDGVLVDSEVLALEVELAILAEQGLSFEREDYVTRFMGLSYEAFHTVIDAEAQKRLGRSISGNIRGELAQRLRQTMIARLTEVPGAVAAVAGTPLLKAVASSSTKEGLERKLRQVGLWAHFEPHVYSADHVVNAKPAPDLFCMPRKSWVCIPTNVWCWKTASMAWPRPGRRACASGAFWVAAMSMTGWASG